MAVNPIHELTDEELKQRLRDKQDALFNFRMQMATGSVDNTRGPRNARRDIARIKTVMRQRELAAEKAAENKE
jgi:large subunit ribosomal protein L29